MSLDFYSSLYLFNELYQYKAVTLNEKEEGTILWQGKTVTLAHLTRSFQRTVDTLFQDPLTLQTRVSGLRLIHRFEALANEEFHLKNSQYSFRALYRWLKEGRGMKQETQLDLWNRKLRTYSLREFERDFFESPRISPLDSRYCEEVHLDPDDWTQTKWIVLENWLEKHSVLQCSSLKLFEGVTTLSSEDCFLDSWGNPVVTLKGQQIFLTTLIDRCLSCIDEMRTFAYDSDEEVDVPKDYVSEAQPHARKVIQSLRDCVVRAELLRQQSLWHWLVGLVAFPAKAIHQKLHAAEQRLLSL